MRSRNVLMLFVALPASAAAYDEPVGAYGAAQGGAVSANPRSNDAVLKNPAVGALVERYDAQIFGLASGNTLGAGLLAVDSRTVPEVALGVGYAYAVGNPPMTDSELPGWIAAGGVPTNRQKGHDVALSAGVPLAERRVALGLGGTFQAMDHERLGTTYDGDLDVGVAWRPKPGVSFALQGQDLIPVPSLAHPARVGGGVWLGAEDLGGLAVDASYRLEDADGSPLDASAGFERQFGGAAVFGGWRWSGRYELHAASLGAGWHQEGTWLDLALDVPFATPFDAKRVAFRLGVRLAG